MNEALQPMVLKVLVLRKMRKNEADIKTTLIQDGLTAEQAEIVIQLANALEIKIEEEKKADREKYSGDLNEDLIEELIQKVIEWHVNGNPNDYQIKENLIDLGVEEKYHQEISEEAYQRVWKATHSEANKRILLGVVITLIGLPILAIGIAATGGGGWQLFAIPFGYGLYTIYVGYKQKNAI